jgi:hypothetical protein
MPFIFVGPEFRLSARKYSRHFRPGFQEAEDTLTTAHKGLVLCDSIQLGNVHSFNFAC